jgi:hypothetical protein
MSFRDFSMFRFITKIRVFRVSRFSHLGCQGFYN